MRAIEGTAETVESMWFHDPRPSVGVKTTSREPGASSVLKIAVSNGDVLTIPNGAWSQDNPTLQVLAYLGAKPSELSTDKYLPVKLNEDLQSYLPDHVFWNGKEMLDDTTWGPNA